MGRLLLRAAAISGLSSSIAVEITRASVSALIPLPSWTNILQPQRSSFSLESFISSAKETRSEPLTEHPIQARYCAIALMPEPMIPAKCSDENFRPSIDKGKPSLPKIKKRQPQPDSPPGQSGAPHSSHQSARLILSQPGTRLKSAHGIKLLWPAGFSGLPALCQGWRVAYRFVHRSHHRWHSGWPG